MYKNVKIIMMKQSAIYTITIEIYNNLEERNMLYENGLLTVFNVSKRNENRLVYSVNQNV